MNDRITLGAAVWVAGILAVQWALAPVRQPGRHRGDGSITVPLDDLLGEPSPYTHDFEHAPGVVRQEFGDCLSCDRATAGVRTDDGWWCGECLQPAGTGVTP